MTVNARDLPQFDAIDLVLSDGKVKQVLVRSERNGQAFIDWINVTFNVSAYLELDGICVTDDDVARTMSRRLEDMGFFGISGKRPHGRHFHPHCYVIGDNFGEFCIGHRSNRAMLSISGDGLLHCMPGSLNRLFSFLSQLDDVGGDTRLSRVDVAVDFFTNGPTHEDFSDAYAQGKFVRQRRHIGDPDLWPQYQVRGCVHTRRGREAGLTDYVGARTSDMCVRRYDRGRKEGDPHSSWTRIEIEMKNKDTVIPLDILTNPHKYFCQYPYLAELLGGSADRMETKRKQAEIAVDASIRIIKGQFGKYLRVLRELYDDDAKLLDAVQHEDAEAWPPRLARVTPQVANPIHTSPSVHRHRFFEATDAPFADQ